MPLLQSGPGPGVPETARYETGPVPRRLPWGRLGVLAVTLACLWLLAPKMSQVFAAWDGLDRVHPAWMAALLLLEGGVFVCIWVVQMIALQSDDWFTNATTQLAANAFNRITPGGGATGLALQVRMLGDAGVDMPKALSGLSIQTVLLVMSLCAMPLATLPALVLGAHVPSGLAIGAWTGAALFAVVAALAGCFLSSERAVRFLGRTTQAAHNAVRRHHPVAGLDDRLASERDELVSVLRNRWVVAVAAAMGRWVLEYLALLIVLVAIGASPNPMLVLFAFVAASVLSWVPLTPGGVGFVEAGLSATLVLAGIPAPAALLATLVFRLFSFWLPLPAGAAAAIAFRRRYRPAA
ncbi:MAG TPA: lysylphosphatidylglycerol synthase transmembrane domain-containing protein [Acidimicrobiia bacterium]|nr:lysylphosphatidylglycerol synthase transmembrane domain-containing protein [Acidimicrobiia bacterium]